jgi:tetratricopeptide (TPR) repeat protein
VERIKRIGGKLYEFTPRTTDVLTAQQIFQYALDAEKDNEPDNALELYHRALSYDPSIAGAWVNLGTIHFHWRDFAMAEKCYRNAIAIDPKYVLAQFDLASVLDEQDQFWEAIEHYRKAIVSDSHYSDAHYNLALVYVKIGEQRKAIQHFQLYLRYQDGDDEAYADEAQRMIRKLTRKIGMGIVRKDPFSATVVPQKISIIVE